MSKGVLKYVIKENDTILDVTSNTRDLYNSVNYVIRQTYFIRVKNKTDLLTHFYETLEEYNLIDWWESLEHVNFKSYGLYNTVTKHIVEHGQIPNMPSKIVQSLSRKICYNWKSFILANKQYREDPSTFTGKPKPPKYLELDKLPVLECNKQTISKRALKNNQVEVKVLKINVTLPSNIESKQVESARLKYKNKEYIFEVIYSKPIRCEKSTGGVVAAIDLGIKNNITITFNDGSQPIIIHNGCINRYNYAGYKRVSELQSLLETHTQPDLIKAKISSVWTKVEKQQYNEVNRLVNRVIKELKSRDVSKIVVGYNEGWKQGKLRKNYKHVQYPYLKVLHGLEYKSELNGITLVRQEESYTSMASYRCGDYIPVYGKDDHLAVFSGKRYKQGLYCDKLGREIHGDVNGSYNIMRKSGEVISLDLPSIPIKNNITR